LGEMEKRDLIKSIPTNIKSKELVEKRREQIVIAAIKLFSQKGFVKTTLKDLAEEAGLSYGNVYDYVGNKEDIFLLVHEFVTGEADQGLANSMENVDDPLEKLKRMIHSEFELSNKWSGAILFVYQDIHVLNKELLHKLLRKESEHVKKFRNVLDACIEKGHLRNFNTQVLANLIKIMIDSWVIKRWDLRGITQFQMENAIVNLVLNGLSSEKAARKRSEETSFEFEGKSVLIVNGGSIFGSAISSFLISRGARLVIYDPCDDMSDMLKRSPSLDVGEREKIKIYTLEEYGLMTQQLLLRILGECGPIDMVVQDIGVGGSEMSALSERKALLNKRLVENFHMARNISETLDDGFTRKRPGKILYIAPWAWDKHVDAIIYETIKASTIALAKENSRRMHDLGVMVNCLVPGYIGGIRGLSARDKKTSNPEIDSILKMRRLGDVSDIVNMVAFLISDSAKYVTGQVITVDGGIS